MKHFHYSLIINGAIGQKNNMTISFMSEQTKNLVSTLPPRQLIWYPYFFTTQNKFLYNILFLFFHIIPGMLFDVVFKYSKNDFRYVYGEYIIL